jgi:hypothetical protein
MHRTEIAREARKQRRLEALDSNDPHCCMCGMTDWECLEAHHLADHDRDKTTIIVCRNCHVSTAVGFRASGAE